MLDEWGSIKSTYEIRIPHISIVIEYNNGEIDLYKADKSIGSKLDNIRNQISNEIMAQLGQTKVKKIQIKGFDR